MRNSRLIFGVLQWLVRSAVSRIRSYVYDSRRVRFLPVKVYERYVEDRLLSVRSKQRNESFFACLNVVALIFCLFIFFKLIFHVRYGQNTFLTQNAYLILKQYLLVRRKEVKIYIVLVTSDVIIDNYYVLYTHTFS